MRLIDADALKASLIESRDRCIEWISDCDESMKPRAEQALYTFNECIMRINDQLTVEERKKGKWIKNSNGTWSCNQCQSWIPDEQHFYANYCLYCGADMRGED